MNDDGPNGRGPNDGAPSGSRPHGFEDRLKAALLARLPEGPAPTPARAFVRR
ncbi:hypothetical protein OG311_07790 [Streptomyces sp. NBC_01343]|uniref:hypothetical protein n=1 Tax=Streptomyces sp. NBC_01343 TaxID=2903832 RepID=UPI002E126EFB|nr:hypothetical protein OG311_07790 [Streptomyces sp. NBC_01343]